MLAKAAQMLCLFLRLWNQTAPLLLYLTKTQDRPLPHLSSNFFLQEQYCCTIGVLCCTLLSDCRHTPVPVITFTIRWTGCRWSPPPPCQVHVLAVNSICGDIFRQRTTCPFSKLLQALAWAKIKESARDRVRGRGEGREIGYTLRQLIAEFVEANKRG